MPLRICSRERLVLSDVYQMEISSLLLKQPEKHLSSFKQTRCKNQYEKHYHIRILKPCLITPEQVDTAFELFLYPGCLHIRSMWY